MLVKFLLFLSASPNKDGSWCVLWLWFSLSTKLNELRPQAAGFLLLETENNESVLKRKLSWMAPKAFYLELGLSVALWEIMDPAFSEFIPYLSSFQSSSHRQRCLQNGNTSAKIQFVSISVKFLLFVSSNKDGSQHFFLYIYIYIKKKKKADYDFEGLNEFWPQLFSRLKKKISTTLFCKENRPRRLLKL